MDTHIHGQLVNHTACHVLRPSYHTPRDTLVLDLVSFTWSLRLIQCVTLPMSYPPVIQVHRAPLTLPHPSSVCSIRTILRYTSCYILLQHPQACCPASYDSPRSKSPEGLFFIRRFTAYRKELPQCDSIPHSLCVVNGQYLLLLWLVVCASYVQRLCPLCSGPEFVVCPMALCCMSSPPFSHPVPCRLSSSSFK